METKAGIELTDDEVKLVKELEKLAKKWKTKTKRLWLYSASGSLTLMMYGGTDTNPHPEETRSGGVNPDNAITVISGIPNDGGDW